MPRKLIEKSKEFPYHVTARSNNRDWFDLPLEVVFSIYAKVLKETIEKYKIQCHGFVLMSNHFHMLISTPEGNISEAMRYFMTETSRLIARSSGRINRIYGKRYHWTIIKDSRHYAHTLRYMFRNPIKAKIVNRVEEYDFSSLVDRKREYQLSITQSLNGYEEYIPQCRNELLHWLNQNFDDLYEEQVSKALRKHEFKFSTNKNSGKKYSEDYALHPRNMPGTSKIFIKAVSFHSLLAFGFHLI